MKKLLSILLAFILLIGIKKREAVLVQKIKKKFYNTKRNGFSVPFS